MKHTFIKLNENTIQKKLQESFDLYPNRFAVIEGEKKHTYRDLERESKIVASTLANIGVENGKKIGVLSASAYKTIVAAIGILFSKSLFALLDIYSPVFRLQAQIEKVDYLILDTQCKNSDAFAELDLKHGTLFEYEDFFERQNEGGRKITTFYYPEDPIYLYFTSGSTGEIKGIIGKNKSLVHFIAWEKGELNVTDSDIFSQITSPAFDPYLREVFVPICSGATVCCMENKRVLLSSSQLKSWIIKNQISILHLTPAIFSLLCSKINEFMEFLNLRAILLAGEFPSYSDIAKWRAHNPNTVIYNLYGPTETTMAKLFFKISPYDSIPDLIPVGKPLPEVNVYVVTSDETKRTLKKLCPLGEVGEIYIESEYLTYGYIKKEMNLGAFFDSSSHPEMKVFRTGDYGKKDENGNFILVGRRTDLLKLGGIRMELSEIIASLRKCELVQDAYAVCKNEKIYAFVVSNKTVDEIQIKSVLYKYLPPVYVPKKIYQIERIPLTNNFKVAKTELLDMIK